MIYSNEYGEVNFMDDYPVLFEKKKIGINLSGGVDSALLMFITLRENLSAEIIPITGVDILRPTNEWNAREIVDLFREMFPDSNIASHQVFYYRKMHKDDKTNQHLTFEKKLFSDKIIDVLFHGRTSNPPIEEAKKYNLLHNREERRDKHSHNRSVFLDTSTPFYCPFEYVDKRWIAKMYEKFNLMSNLFPITASCVEYADKTNFFTKPCKECWWCKEKVWAFGMYDSCEL